VTGYHLERREVIDGSTESEWTAVHTVTNRQQEVIQLVVDQLKPGTQYQFRVCAENNFGVGDFSPPSDPVTSMAEPEIKDNPSADLRRYMTLYVDLDISEFWLNL